MSDTAVWGVLPYIVLTIFIGGTVWRFRHDRFGLTTRSSQIHESRLLAIGGPLFHVGLLFVVGGHVIGLVVPESLTERMHVSESLYHLNAVVVGGTAGVAAIAGLAMLLWRRLKVRAVRVASTRSDKVLYPVLFTVMLLGLGATTGLFHGDYDYREGVSVWFRSVFTFHPDVAAMADAPMVFKLHALLGMALLALWPFSRLIHAFAAPVGYLFRPYVVYRSRGSVGAPRTRSSFTRGSSSARGPASSQGPDFTQGERMHQTAAAPRR